MKPLDCYPSTSQVSPFSSRHDFSDITYLFLELVRDSPISTPASPRRKSGVMFPALHHRTRYADIRRCVRHSPTEDILPFKFIISIRRRSVTDGQ
ncbi:Uncharacterized protein HZ326_1587 [Fusarium oxysporum f. sp. albedinis]|nr:Uncharacterized protein HZ326_1587 [Fusarium oxysporum f. sp. albedinis]